MAVLNQSYPVSELEKLARQGSAEAELCLGILCELGAYHGHDNDAEAWLRAAAKKNSAIAQHILGTRLQLDLSNAAALEEARVWLEKAALSGLAQSATALGAMYHLGYGGIDGKATALKWYRYARKLGDPEASTMIANLYAQGGPHPNSDISEAFLREGAARGDIGALAALGEMLVEKEDDPFHQESFDLLARAADAGSLAALFRLSELYRTGRKGWPLDQQKSEFFLAQLESRLWK